MKYKYKLIIKIYKFFWSSHQFFNSNQIKISNKKYFGKEINKLNNKQNKDKKVLDFKLN